MTSKKNSNKILEKQYETLFNNLIKVIEKEDNVSLVYQVLVDLIMQIEEQVKNDLGSCSGNCGGCNDNCDH